MKARLFKWLRKLRKQQFYYFDPYRRINVKLRVGPYQRYYIQALLNTIEQHVKDGDEEQAGHYQKNLSDYFRSLEVH